MWTDNQKNYTLNQPNRHLEKRGWAQRLNAWNSVLTECHFFHQEINSQLSSVLFYEIRSQLMTILWGPSLDERGQESLLGKKAEGVPQLSVFTDAEPFNTSDGMVPPRGQNQILRKESVRSMAYLMTSRSTGSHRGYNSPSSTITIHCGTVATGVIDTNTTPSIISGGDITIVSDRSSVTWSP